MNGKKGYRVRINGSNEVVTTGNVSFCAFPSTPTAVAILPDDQPGTSTPVITSPSNQTEVDARMNIPVTSEVTPTMQPEEPVVITQPYNSKEAFAAAAHHTYSTHWC